MTGGGQTDIGSRYDAIIIGSGLGGAPLAYRLGLAGLKVLVLERGDYLRAPPDGASGAAGRFLNSRVPDRSGGISCVGGSTKFYGAALYRLRESDFRAVEHENGVSPAWPFGYATLEPYYQEAEVLFRVHGAADADSHEPPRKAPFPFPPIPNPPLISRMAARLERVGGKIEPIPRALDHRPGGPCILCAECVQYYCHLDARMDAETAALRPAVATGNVQVATNTECLRVLTEADGRRVRGVVARWGNDVFEVRAETVAVCAGYPHTAVLLRKSRNGPHPDGLGAAGGSLGRYLGAHSTGLIFPIVGLGKAPPTHTKSFAINQYYESSPDWPYPTGAIQTVGQTPIWENVSKIMRPFAKLVAERSVICAYMTEALPTRETGLFFRDDDTFVTVESVQNTKTFERLRRLTADLFRAAGYPVLARPRRHPHQWHPVGGARLGDDPATSVIDRDCQMHGVRGLFVVDSSVMPSAGAVNTGLTIIALSLRVGDHIAGSRSRG